MHCVIGSGPAGVACAKALLAQGAEVLMLDAGVELEPDRAEIVRRLGTLNASEWPAENVAALKRGMLAPAGRAPQKLTFGSDYPYRDTDGDAPWRGQGASVRPSLALGGFSTVWGAAMLPYRDDDLADWPVKSGELARHYEAVLNFVDFSAQPDDLEKLFPLYSRQAGRLRSSRQADQLLQNLAQHRTPLQRAGWYFGRARLAIRAGNGSGGCTYCRMCLYGCPYGCIYNSADTVREMQADQRFKYQPDVIVTKLREEGRQVVVEGHHRRTREPLSFTVDRVFLAAGIVPTTRILLRSQGAYDRPLQARDSQYFIFPLLMARRLVEVSSEDAYTLSQLFIEIINNPRVSRRPVHLQIYTYNDIIAQTVRKAFGPFKFLAKPLEQRILIAQGYLHSDESPTIEMTLKRDGDRDYLQLSSEPHPEMRRTVKRVLREFFRQSRSIGGIPMTPMLQLMLPGQGFHSGGSFPMRAEPREFESDRLGRPHGWSRVHAVDATIFPSVPATTITFPVMANAHRIGWESAKL
ncbi:MAG TPA: hypothetical protein VN625_04205 [Desulfuromonadaceae bacterium]|nr:hypothetical protein [Desulfuromonadaceae bacterium]